MSTYRRKYTVVKIKELFEKHSILKFTYELSIDRKLPFLDVVVTSSADKFDPQVYRKPTNVGSCLNANSECVDKYKDSVAFSFLNRAYKISNNWNHFHQEVQYIKQMLVNNNYTNSKVDALVNRFIDNKLKSSINTKDKNSHIIPIY